MMRKLPSLFFVVALVVALFAVNDVATIPEAFAQALPGGSVAPSGANIRETRHNLSPSRPLRTVTSGNLSTTEPVLESSSTTEICVYCHTPHGASGADKPLWNRQDSNETYSPYTSSSLNASDLDMANLATPSKLCLSCHDGSIAIGAVSNAPGSGAGEEIKFGGASASMPLGRNQPSAEHGFTRRLGTDLRNDHPIAFTYDTTLAVADGELRNPSGSTTPTLIANRVLGSPKPNFPLVGGQVQCSTCHDPHRNTQKFLVKNRLAQDLGAPANAPENRQLSGTTNWEFNDTYDQICLGCHTRLGKSWGQSAHSSSVVADEAYKDGDAAVRDFPMGTKVWQAGCLNCHDTHTVAGSRRLLREGVDSGTSAVSLGYTANIRSGVGGASDYSSTSAVENTCYQCHSTNSIITPTVLSAAEGVPNIQAEFERAYHMPIKNADQGDPYSGNSSEVHDISDADGVESQTGLGYVAPENRHAECTDCHNPHRVVKADTFLGANLSGADLTRRTHVPNRGTTGNQGNIASGALRGTWGVEPSYSAFGQTNVTSTSVWLSAAENPTFTVKKGDPGAASALPDGTGGTNSTSYLTREYQLCFKCHSSYANGPNATDFPELKTVTTRGGTQRGTSAANKMARYTNVAAEFAVLASDPPLTGTHQGESGGNAALTPVGASWDSDQNALTINHRSWHPVIFPTGRNRAERRMDPTGDINMQPPWAAKMGTQTMHCSDCHGNTASYSWRVGPKLDQVQGPHGSTDPFILKGIWNQTLNIGSSGVDAGKLCGNCHNPRASSGTRGGTGTGHSWSDMGSVDCMNCHIAVPHGWKNKAFLVNRDCVGREGGAANDCSSISGWSSFDRLPYYVSAALRVDGWVASGGWTGMSPCGGDSMDGCND